MTRIAGLVVAGVLAFVTGAACSFKADLGEPCLKDDECQSDTCHWGICVTGTCSGEGQSSCPDGWYCIDPPPSSNGVILDALLGKSDPIGHCALECEGCPTGDRYSCSDHCAYDHAPYVTIEGPETALAGAAIELRAAVDLAPGRSVAVAEWSWYDDAGPVTAQGLEITATFHAIGEREVTLTLHDDADQGISATHRVAVCVDQGDACESDYACCGGSICDEGRCVPEPVCGNGIVERGETCDGAAPEGAACSDYDGYRGEGLGCGAECDDVDLSGCERCGVTFDDCTSDAQCCDGYTCGGIDWCISK
ncbi:MAG: hypothetical protein R3B09_33620 [Nannocystaceae bacterium]